MGRCAGCYDARMDRLGGVFRRLRTAVAAATLGSVLMSAAARAWDDAPVPAQELAGRLQRASKAHVSSACGSTAAPWAYRGARLRPTTVRPYFEHDADRAWVQRFTRVLLEGVTTDSVANAHTPRVPCGGTDSLPLVIVNVPVRDHDTYVLLQFHTRWTVMFEPDRPLAAIPMGSRAESLFALVRAALPNDPVLQSMASLPPPDTIAAPAHAVFVEQLPEAVDKVRPEYPEGARRRGIEGQVDVDALIGADGLVQDAYVRRTVPGLDDAALDAVWQWRFNPARSGGKPVPVWVRVPVKFRLE